MQVQEVKAEHKCKFRPCNIEHTKSNLGPKEQKLKALFDLGYHRLTTPHIR